jgi:hypothetical protein
MDDRVKRPYHKSADRWNIGKTQENTVEVISDGVDLDQEKKRILEEGSKQFPARELTYNDLPESTRKGVEKAINNRKIANLPDDSETRKQNAVNYRKWELSR